VVSPPRHHLRLAASALPGAKWVDTDVPIEMIFPNHRAMAGVITRNTALPDEEVTIRGSMTLTTVERTAFDLALSGRVGQAVARLDALASATHFKNRVCKNWRDGTLGIEASGVWTRFSNWLTPVQSPRRNHESDCCC